VTYAVNRELANTSTHRWRPGEDPDSLTDTWTDTSTVLAAGLRPSLTHHAAHYAIDGVISVEEGTSLGDRLNTTITVTDAATHSHAGVGGTQRWTLDDTYTGEATWTLGVPRPDRHAIGTSRERYQLRGDHPSRHHSTCYDRTIATVNGFITHNTNTCEYITVGALPALRRPGTRTDASIAPFTPAFQTATTDEDVHRAIFGAFSQQDHDPQLGAGSGQ